MRASITSAVTLSLCLMGGAAHAGDCKDAGQYAAKLVEAAMKICEQGQGRFKNCDVSKVGGVVDQAAYWIKWWNDMVGNTWAKVGPRQLSFNARDQGTLLNPGVRTFISIGPSAGKGRVEINALDGKAGVEVSYCAIKSDGSVEFLGKDTAGSGQSPPARDLSEEQIGGKFVVIKLDGTGGAMKRYQYHITLNGTLVR